MKLAPNLTMVLTAALRSECKLAKVSCPDGSKVAWVQEVRGERKVLGSVRAGTATIPPVQNRSLETELQVSAEQGWEPVFASCTDGGSVAWMKQCVMLGSVQGVSPLNADDIQHAEALLRPRPQAPEMD